MCCATGRKKCCFRSVSIMFQCTKIQPSISQGSKISSTHFNWTSIVFSHAFHTFETRLNDFYWPKTNRIPKWDIIDVRWLFSVLPLTALQKSNVWASGQKRPDYTFAVRLHRLWSQRSRRLWYIFKLIFQSFFLRIFDGPFGTHSFLNGADRRFELWYSAVSWAMSV